MTTAIKAFSARDINGLAIIGRTMFALRGIRFADGEGGAEGGADENSSAGDNSSDTKSSNDQRQSEQKSEQRSSDSSDRIKYRGEPDDYVRELRQEARTHREAAEAAAATAAEREKERDAAASARDDLARANKLILTAPKLGANAEMLLDSSSFMKTFAAVDLAKPDDVKKAIEDALERNSAFKAGPALPGASGGGHQGGHNNKSTPTLQGAVSKALGG